MHVNLNHYSAIRLFKTGTGTGTFQIFGIGNSKITFYEQF